MAFSDAAMTAGTQVGRHFSVVSVVPSAVFVGYGFLLAESGAWSGPPDWAKAVDAFANISLGGASALALLAFALALALHPLQFAFVQILEGYWGGGEAARRLAAARIRRHRARAGSAMDAADAWDTWLRASELDPDSEYGAPLVDALVARDAAGRTADRYPQRLSRIMPTRLGNVLRRFEDDAGEPYGLSAIGVAPHLALVAEGAHTDYLDNCREQLDLAVRVCLLSAVAFVFTAVALFPYGAPLLVSLAPYAVAYLAYRGAIVAAEEYGVALSTLLDLDRFRLYEALHVALPSDTRSERQCNEGLGALLARDVDAEDGVPYRHPR